MIMLTIEPNKIFEIQETLLAIKCMMQPTKTLKCSIF